MAEPLPANQANDKEDDGGEVALVPHILNVDSDSLAQSHRPYKEGLEKRNCISQSHCGNCHRKPWRVQSCLTEAHKKKS